MTKVTYLEKTIEIPKDVTFELKGMQIKITGPNGTLQRDFSGEPVNMVFNKNILILSVSFPRKKEAAMIGTIEAHVKNMLIGVTKGYTYRLKIVYSHFPITAEVKQRDVLIKNLYGQKEPKKVKIFGDDVKVRVEGDEVILTGINKEHIGQTSANIQEACKLRGAFHKDPRRFMDGIWLSAQSIGIE